MTTYQKLDNAKQELCNDEWQQKKAIASKITLINGQTYIDTNAYKSAKDVAKKLALTKYITGLLRTTRMIALKLTLDHLECSCLHKTKWIIMRALAKKGINYKDFKEIITMQLPLAFGIDYKVISF